MTATKKVSLTDVADAFLDGSGERTHYVDRVTGDVLFLGDDTAVEDVFEIPAAALIAVGLGELGVDDANPDRYVCLPGPGERFELDAMREFARTRPDDDDGRRLVAATFGTRLYRHFKDEVYRQDLRDEWFAYRLLHVAPLARAWLEGQGIPYDDDVRPHLRLIRGDG